ncbi:MAG: DNA (cytosine-5-)-methyltransferase [Clostridia bacterium]|nr:DNA (cytosine-5-)-methyltransferase [Clostridia bacterium]
MKVISLFSGIGGIDLGFKQAGFDIVWANDMDADVCKTYQANFGENSICECDIRDVDANDIPDADVLVAGFPCQPFSIMGYKRGFKDPRGNLFFEISRIVDKKRPEIILLENVKNLMHHDDGKTFLVIYNTLAQFGYGIKYKVMDAVKYGNLPQYRSRIFLAAFLDYDKLDRFAFPEETELTMGINDVIDRSVKHSDVYYYDQQSKYYDLLQKRVTSDGIYRIDDSGVAMRKWTICPTLKANMGTYPDRVPIIQDNHGIRKLTPYECLAFQGYPTDYRFPKIPLESAYKQCGNTVAVPVVRRIANNINKGDEYGN